MPQQGQNVQMLHSLGHNPLVRSDDQQSKIDPSGSGQHILDEFFMSRHIHDPGLRAVGQSRWAKPKSMVMPRHFSSASRSVSVPVSALISTVLP